MEECLCLAFSPGGWSLKARPGVEVKEREQSRDCGSPWRALWDSSHKHLSVGVREMPEDGEMLPMSWV